MPHEAVARTLTPAERAASTPPTLPTVRKSPDQRRSHVITLRISEAEHARFQRLTSAMDAALVGVGVTIGQAVRMAALEALPMLEERYRVANDPTPAKAKPKK